MKRMVVPTGTVNVSGVKALLAMCTTVSSRAVVVGTTTRTNAPSARPNGLHRGSPVILLLSGPNCGVADRGGRPVVAYPRATRPDRDQPSILWPVYDTEGSHAIFDGGERALPPCGGGAASGAVLLLGRIRACAAQMGEAAA